MSTENRHERQLAAAEALFDAALPALQPLMDLVSGAVLDMRDALSDGKPADPRVEAAIGYSALYRGLQYLVKLAADGADEDGAPDSALLVLRNAPALLSAIDMEYGRAARTVAESDGEALAVQFSARWTHQSEMADAVATQEKRDAAADGESERFPTLVDDVKISATDRIRWPDDVQDVWDAGRDACEAVKDISYAAWFSQMLGSSLHKRLAEAAIAEIAAPIFTVAEDEEEPDNPPNRVDEITPDPAEVEANPEGVKELLDAGRDAIAGIQFLAWLAWSRDMLESRLYRDLKDAIVREANGGLPNADKG